MLKYVYILFLLTVGCEQNKSEIPQVEKKQPVKLPAFEELNAYVFDVSLTNEVKDSLKAWKAYFEFTEFLTTNFKEISPSMALEYATELSERSKTMNDSLKIRTLNTKGVFARLHTLYSEVLRLNDMEAIPSIKAEEVVEQTRKIASVYNSLNAKINAVYAQKNFDKDVDFDESIFNFGAREETPYQRVRKPRKRYTKNSRSQNEQPSFER